MTFFRNVSGLSFINNQIDVFCERDATLPLRVSCVVLALLGIEYDRNVHL
jgi:hypothetical protein